VSRVKAPGAPMVGNEFVMPKAKTNKPSPVMARPIAPIVQAPMPIMAANVPVIANETLAEPVDVHITQSSAKSRSTIQPVIDFMHHYSLGVFAILLFVVLASAIQVASFYLSDRYAIDATNGPIKAYSRPLRGPNMSVESAKLNETVQQLSAQPISVTVGTKNVPFSAETISSWLAKTIDKKTGVAYIHVNQDAIANSLKQTTEPFAYAPRDQITVTHEDGTSRVLVSGRDGTSLTDTSHLSKQIASSLLAAKGMQLNVPLQTIPFRALTPANFDKFIEVDVTTKRMYMYHGGQLERTFLISAGAPETPTPLGQYKIYAKFTRQDMRGFNPNGTKYFQPNVQWINYFYAGNAIHGNYWRPTSWFGNRNSSHGCVSLPNDEAKWVYDWTPIGTPIVTHS